MTDRAQFKRLTEAEALRALYIDFEGEKGTPPVLLGVHRRGRGASPFVHQDIVDDAFAGLGESARTLRAAVTTVVQRAERGNRRIVSWSEYDLGVVRTLGQEDPGLVARFEARYANARAVAERWRNKRYGGNKPRPGRLIDYLGLIEYVVPADAAGGSVGNTVRDLRPRLERRQTLTVTQRRRWDRLIEHNRFDCAGTRRVCLRATRELELAEEQLR